MSKRLLPQKYYRKQTRNHGYMVIYMMIITRWPQVSHLAILRIADDMSSAVDDKLLRCDWLVMVRLVITRAVRHLAKCDFANDRWRHDPLQLRLDAMYLDHCSPWVGLGWIEIFHFLVGWVGSTTAEVLKNMKELC